ncbi:MAG: hypothetical protein PUB95_05910 [Methanobrevibacter ruminantium]|uniref:MarR family winged helix-turn-helix transcriptional regulator n=1 Tax=Methanobrevibacter ruminantium TaxID=83816 RepID=UPI0026F2CD23|nr:hypothetical protein [Methanobrevibacter ruminantium]MDD6048971.1 hypothetical protein [Methanobrevibacter ruminantium]
MARELNIFKQHVSLILKEFISDGYVETVSNPNDKRANLVSISKLGQEFLNEHVEISNQVFNDIVSKLNEEDKKKFLDAMDTIFTILNNVE